MSVSTHCEHSPSPHVTPKWSPTQAGLSPPISATDHSPAPPAQPAAAGQVRHGAGARIPLAAHPVPGLLQRRAGVGGRAQGAGGRQYEPQRGHRAIPAGVPPREAPCRECAKRSTLNSRKCGGAKSQPQARTILLASGMCDVLSCKMCHVMCWPANIFH